jgi:chemoreceptor-like protein with four helix bundle sensory module
LPLVRWLRSFRPSGSQLLISLLIAGLGWLSGQALSRVDQDLRIMYTEYTLGAADLAHISADVMRYRNTIIRALEADSQKEYERITESLPGQRARIQLAVDRYAAAGLRVSRSGRSEPEDIEAVRRSLDQYFSVASTTIQLLTQEWTASSPLERDRLRRKAEEHASDNAGPKMIQVSLALDHLLDTVADVAKDMRDEGTRAIQSTSIMLVGGSFFIALLNLFFTRPRGSRPDDGEELAEADHKANPTPLSLPRASDQHHPA